MHTPPGVVLIRTFWLLLFTVIVAMPTTDALAQTRVADLQQACAGGDASACYNLGWMYDDGEGVTKDLSRAAALYEQSCTGGYARGCFNLGLLYGNGEGVTEDSTRCTIITLLQGVVGCSAGEVEETNLGHPHRGQ